MRVETVEDLLYWMARRGSQLSVDRHRRNGEEQVTLCLHTHFAGRLVRASMDVSMRDFRTETPGKTLQSLITRTESEINAIIREEISHARREQAKGVSATDSHQERADDGWSGYEDLTDVQ